MIRDVLCAMSLAVCYAVFLGAEGVEVGLVYMISLCYFRLQTLMDKLDAS